MLQSIELQRIGHDLVTEQQQIKKKKTADSLKKKKKSREILKSKEPSR